MQPYSQVPPVHTMAAPVPPVPFARVETNHLLHFLIGLVTCGLWWLMWPVFYFMNNSTNNRRAREYDQAVAEYNRQVHIYRQSQYR